MKFNTINLYLLNKSTIYLGTLLDLLIFYYLLITNY